MNDKNINDIDRLNAEILKGREIKKKINESLEELEKKKKKVIQESPKIKVPVPLSVMDKKTEQSSKIIYKVKSYKKWYYIVPFFIIFITLSLFIFFMYGLKNYLYTILFTFIGLPFLLLSIKFLVVRLFLDKKHIKGFVIKHLSKNYIIANFYKENKRIVKTVCLLNQDGITFNHNKGLYILDLEAVWYDENNRPNSFYKYDMPNPIILDLTSIMSAFNVALAKKEDLRDEQGKVIDIVFSSLNLQTFKKNKIIEEFSKNPEMMKLVYAMAGLVALAFIVIIIMQFVGN